MPRVRVQPARPKPLDKMQNQENEKYISGKSKINLEVL
jgi:hypothetical protein